jgi:hypothetical protein
MKQKLKMGMVGGGGEAFIGVIHQMAAQLDGKIEFIAGAFSSNAERSKRSGETLGLHHSPANSSRGAEAAQPLEWLGFASLLGRES